MDFRELYPVLVPFAFAFGAVVASFLNVVIWRVPRGESLVSPPSHCPKCNAPIRWYQNIPILSWLALRGKCARCHASISPRYLIIEVLGGALFLLTFLKFGLSLHTALLWVWLSLAIVGSAIDFDLKLLPDFVTCGGMVLGVVYNAAQSVVFHSPFFIVNSLAGLALGFGLLWLVRFLGSKAFKQEAMGMGDVFLFGAVGAISGPVGVFFTLIFASFIGAVGGVAALVISRTGKWRRVEIPFGPSIFAAHILYFFLGAQILHWYLALGR